MSLSCECGFEWDGEGWYWETPVEITTPVDRLKRCCSCNSLIRIASDALEFPRYRAARDGIEYEIYDDNPIQIASKYMCESCGDLFWPLEELGYCISLGDDMNKLVAEHAEQHSKGLNNETSY